MIQEFQHELPTPTFFMLSSFSTHHSAHKRAWLWLQKLCRTSPRGHPAVTLKQFAALQAKGDRSERELLRTLRNTMPDSLDSERQSSWRAALNFLGLLDNRCALNELNLPTLHILGHLRRRGPWPQTCLVHQAFPRGAPSHGCRRTNLQVEPD